MELDALSDNPTAQRGSELCAREESMAQVRAVGDLGGVPLIVLASTERLPSSPDPVAVAWNLHQIEEVQPGQAKLSTRGRLVRVERDISAPMIIDSIRNVFTTP